MPRLEHKSYKVTTNGRANGELAGLRRRIRAMFRDLRPRRVGEPGGRSEREHAALPLGGAAFELADPDAHVASQNVRAGIRLDDDRLVSVRVPGRGQQADSR